MSRTQTITRDAVREALEQAGASWIFRYWGNDADGNLARIATDLERFATEYRRRFKETPDPLALIADNPTKGAAFFQPDTLAASVEMKIMVWRILLGCELAKVDFKYRAGREYALTITLRAPYGGNEEVYEGQQPSDFRILRHFGVTSVGEQLYLQGYYAARGV